MLIVLFAFVMSMTSIASNGESKTFVYDGSQNSIDTNSAAQSVTALKLWATVLFVQAADLAPVLAVQVDYRLQVATVSRSTARLLTHVSRQLLFLMKLRTMTSMHA